MPSGPRTWSCTTWRGCSIHAAPFRCAGGRTCKHDASFDNKHGQLARPLRAPVARSSSSSFWLHLAYHHSGILRCRHRLHWGIQSDSRPPTPRCMRLFSVRMQPSTAAWTTRTPTPSTCSALFFSIFLGAVRMQRSTAATNAPTPRPQHVPGHAPFPCLQRCKRKHRSGVTYARGVLRVACVLSGAFS